MFRRIFLFRHMLPIRVKVLSRGEGVAGFVVLSLLQLSFCGYWSVLSGAVSFRCQNFSYHAPLHFKGHTGPLIVNSNQQAPLQ